MLNLRFAGSLVLSLLNSLLVVIALPLAYSGLVPWWVTLALWSVPLPFVFFTIGYIVADVVKSRTRKQALIALAILAPTAAVEWYFRFTGI